jgi:hypothetical protein
MSFLKKLTGNQEEQKGQDEEQAAQKYVLTCLKILQQTAHGPLAALAHDFTVTLEQKSVKATFLWQRRTVELTQAANEETERLGKLEAWRQFCKNGLTSRLQAVGCDGRLQLSTDNENVSLTVDPDVPELVTGTLRDGRTSTTKLEWRPWRWLNLIEQEVAAHPEATCVVLDETLSFASVKLPKEILLSITVPLTFIFKDHRR